MLAAGTASSVIIMLVQFCPEPFRKCSKPEPDAGALNVKLLLVMTGHGCVQTGSRMMMPGSREFALAQTDNSANTMPPRSSLAKVLTTQAPYLKISSVVPQMRKLTHRRGSGFPSMAGEKELSRTILNDLRIIGR